MSSTARDFLSLILPCGHEDFGRHNELRPDLFEKILVLASDAVLAPVGQEVMGITRCESEVTGTLMVLEQN